MKCEEKTTTETGQRVNVLWLARGLRVWSSNTTPYYITILRIFFFYLEEKINNGFHSHMSSATRVPFRVPSVLRASKKNNEQTEKRKEERSTQSTTRTSVARRCLRMFNPIFAMRQFYMFRADDFLWILFGFRALHDDFGEDKTKLVCRWAFFNADGSDDDRFMHDSQLLFCAIRIFERLSFCDTCAVRTIGNGSRVFFPFCFSRNSNHRQLESRW